MKITIKHYDVEIAIENEHDDLTLDQVMDELVKPLLLSIGFQPKTIEEYFRQE